MSQKIINSAIKLLSEMKTDNSINTIDVLIEHLENKVDPEPSELYLLESLYQFKEKLKIIESKLNSYVIQSRHSILGNKLETLYNNSNGYGTSKMIND